MNALLWRNKGDDVPELLGVTSWQQYGIKTFNSGRLKKNLMLRIWGASEESKNRRRRIEKVV